jgi:hypothetical protein
MSKMECLERASSLNELVQSEAFANPSEIWPLICPMFCRLPGTKSICLEVQPPPQVAPHQLNGAKVFGAEARENTTDTLH